MSFTVEKARTPISRTPISGFRVTPTPFWISYETVRDIYRNTGEIGGGHCKIEAIKALRELYRKTMNPLALKDAKEIVEAVIRQENTWG